jgi:hypothetical protein
MSSKIIQHKKKRGSPKGSAFPPQYNSSTAVNTVLRFETNVATANKVITIQNIGDLFYTATGATAGYQLMNAFRLRKVEMWCTGSAATLLGQLMSLEFSGVAVGAIGPSKAYSAIAMGVAKPGHIYVELPKDGSWPAAQWHNSTDTSPLFKLSMPEGAIIDLHLQFTVSDNLIAVPISGAKAGLTLGVAYINSLDSTTVPPTLNSVNLNSA